MKRWTNLSTSWLKKSSNIGHPIKLGVKGLVGRACNRSCDRLRKYTSFINIDVNVFYAEIKFTKNAVKCYYKSLLITFSQQFWAKKCKLLLVINKCFPLYAIRMAAFLLVVGR